MQPKQSIKLNRIKEISVIDDQDKKKHKKLRTADAAFMWFKIEFYRDGIVKDASQQGAESDEEEGEDQGKEGGDTASWYFMMEDQTKRDEVIS